MTRTRKQVIDALADAGRVLDAAPGRTWRDALFTPDGDGAWALSRPTDPDRALLAALADEFVELDAHVATVPDRLHEAWLRDILAIPALPVVPDRVIASASVDPKLAPAVVPKGTMLRGGKDAFGNERRYRTTDALTAHGATVVGVCATVPGGPRGTQDGPGLTLGASDAASLPIIPPSTEQEAATSAFVAQHRLRISSPVLAFSSGDMTVELDFADGVGIAALRAAARWRYRTAAGVLTEPSAADGGTGTVIRVRLTDGCADPDGGDPWVEGVIDQGSAVPENVSFTGVSVSVVERRDVVPDAGFANDGLVDITKEFEPFAATAAAGDAFYLRSDEALSKPLQTLAISTALFAGKKGGIISALDIDRLDDTMVLEAYSISMPLAQEQATGSVYLPQHGYWGAGASSANVAQRSVHWQRLLAGGWSPLGPTLGGFGSATATDLGGSGSLPTEVSGQPGRYVRCFIDKGDLGWADYQQAIADFATAAAQQAIGDKAMPTPIKAAKYANLRLSYTTAPTAASRVESFSAWRHAVHDGTAWHPFRRDVADAGPQAMVAIGLALDDSVGGSVSLYVELDSASPCGATDEVRTTWEWWGAAGWTALLAADGTSGLRESGLLRFVAPDGWAEGCADVTAARGKWIRMTTDQPFRLGALRAVIPDAVVAEYVSGSQDPQADPSPAVALPPGTIKGTLGPIPGVKKVTNLASVRGRGPEAPDAYLRRASALVRHRGRAIAAWDYEQMVAIQFPEVAAVRCLPHTDSLGARSPGQVGLVLIPDEPTQRAPRPSVSLSGRVIDALAPVMPVGARVAVLCPCYSPVTVTATILLRSGVAAITGTANVTAALEALLHPTATTQTRWGVSLYASALIAALERLAEVDVVQQFSMSGPDVVDDVAAVDPSRGLYCSSGAHALTCKEQL